MKRRSMLGRRSRVVQEHPHQASIGAQLPAFSNHQFMTMESRHPETPRQLAKDRTSPHPFQTPSVNGSLSDLSSREKESWSVFKNTNALKSPNIERGRLTNPERRIGHTSRLNKLKKNDPLCALRNAGFPNILTKKKDENPVALKRPVTGLLVGSDKYKLFNGVNGSLVSKEKVSSQTSVEESDQESVARELLILQKKWEHQDIRAVSPPWSNGPNILSDFNLSTPRPASPATSPPKSPSKLADFSSTLGVALLDSSGVDRKEDNPAKKQYESFDKMESMVNQENESNLQSFDISTVLGNVPLGVNTIELLDKPNMTNLSKANWSTKYKLPLLSVAEEPEVSFVDKENLPPGADDFVSSTVLLTPEILTSPRSQRIQQFKKFQDQVAEITSKIEAAEEKRLEAEEERKLLEVERMRLFEKFFNFFNSSDAQQIGKRRKIAPNSAKKGRPSFVASKLFKKDLKSPKDIAQFVRTPSQLAASNTSVHVPFTPRSLRKNLNQQFNSIFGS